MYANVNKKGFNTVPVAYLQLIFKKPNTWNLKAVVDFFLSTCKVYKYSLSDLDSMN